MNIKVSKDSVIIETDCDNHVGEYNVNECYFQFDTYFNDVSVKRAIFTIQTDAEISVETDIINNTCQIPYEVLVKPYTYVTMGVYGYDLKDDVLTLRYSPEPTKFMVSDGSYKDGASHPEIITPTQYDIYSEALQKGLAEVDKKLDEISENGTYAKEQGDYAKEQGNYAKEQGDYAKEQGNYAKEQGDKIEQIQADIPTQVSQLENDLHYVRDVDYATNNVGGVIKANVGLNVDATGYVSVNTYDYEEYKSKTNNYFIGKGTLENVIAGKKLETADNKVTSISPNSTDEQYPSAKCTYKIKKDLETLKNEVLETGTASDSFINVQDSALAELQELSVEMNKDNVQATTTGQQLYNYKDQISVRNTTVDDDGWLTVELENTQDSPIYADFFTQIPANINIMPNTIYNIFLEIKTLDSTGITSYINIGSPDSENNIYAFTMGGLTKLLSSLTANTVYNFLQRTKNDFDNVVGFLRTFVSIEAHSKVNMTYRLSVYADTTITTGNFVYEKFTGGQPSPNPDYPQEIKTITDSLSVTSCNKNVFDTTKIASGTSSGISYSVDNNGIIILNGTTNGNYIEIPLNTNISLDGTYTYIPKINDKTKINNIALKDASFSNVVLSPLPTTSNINGIVTKIVLYVSSEVVFNNATLSIQILRGTQSTVTSFEQHLQSQITANLPEGEFIGKIDDTYKDKLDIVYDETDGQWHKILKKKLNKYQFSGNENFLLNATTSNYTEFMAYIAGLNASQYNTTKSNGFLYTTDNRITISSANAVYIRVPASLKIDTVDKFKAIIASIYVYYVLATPYEIDLGTVDMPLTYNEVTNIFTDSDLLPIINAKYYRNFIKTVQNLQVNEKALKQELIDINNRLTALETATASESEAILDDIQEQ